MAVPDDVTGLAIEASSGDLVGGIPPRCAGGLTSNEDRR